MKTHPLCVACMLFISFAHGGGREVIVAVGRMGSVRGELVAVGDSALVVALEYDAAGREAGASEVLRTVPLRDVPWVLVKEENYIAAGVGLGLLGGAILGAGLGGIGKDTEAPFMGLSPAASGALTGAGLGALIGGGIGLGIGSALSSEEIRLYSTDPGFIERLRQVSRHPELRDTAHVAKK